MNRLKNSTAAVPNATPLDLVADAIDGPEGIFEKAVSLRHLLRFLESDLCFALDPSRGTIEEHTVRLALHKPNIEATLWLVGQTCQYASDLVEQLQATQRQIDGADQ